MPAELGKKAPAFTAKTNGDKTVKLSDFRDKKNIILYFYPKDDTPGCTKEACSFSEEITKIKKKSTVVIGVSPDSVKSHEKFIDKYDLKFDLLSDESKKICEKYGVWVEKSMYGRKYMGVQRATFLINKSGKIVAHWPKVKVNGHTEEVLEAIQEHC